MKKILVYYPYKLREQKSGSAVRPVKLLEAFGQLAEQKGLELISIHGTLSERQEQLNKLYKEVMPQDILMCYMENATIPIWLSDPDHIPRKPLLDVRFFKWLKRNDIPLGVFYRDIYWKFNDLYKVNPLIKPVFQGLFRRELAVYKKYASAFFLPSMYMNEYVGVKDIPVIPLPPGGINFISGSRTQSSSETPNAIYVGGIHPRYGVYEVLEAINALNQDSIKVNLILVCRKEEYAVYKEKFSPYIEKEWLEIHHAYGDQLLPLYERASFGIVPIKRDIYNDFAVAVKLFEYISYGLPVLATNCKAQEDLVKDGKFGVIVEDNASSILKGLKVLQDEKNRNSLREHAISALKNKHLWIHRAESVFDTLVKK